MLLGNLRTAFNHLFDYQGNVSGRKVHTSDRIDNPTDRKKLFKSSQNTPPHTIVRGQAGHTKMRRIVQSWRSTASPVPSNAEETSFVDVVVLETKIALSGTCRSLCGRAPGDFATQGGDHRPS